MLDSNLTYSEYKSKFEDNDTFLYAFANLSEEDAKMLIANEDTSTTIKAAMFTTWKLGGALSR